MKSDLFVSSIVDFFLSTLLSHFRQNTFLHQVYTLVL